MSEALDINSLANFFAQTSMLQGCPMQVLQQLGAHLQHRNFKMGHVVLDAGAHVEGLMFVASGKAEVNDFHSKPVEVIVTGDVFGVTSLLTTKANKMKVMAKEDCYVVTIASGGVSYLIQHFPALLHRLAYRVATTNLKLGEKLAERGPQAQTIAPVGAPPPTQTTNQSQDTASTPEGVIAYANIDDYQITKEIIKSIPTRLIRNHRVIPLQMANNELKIGMVNPSAKNTLKEISSLFQGVKITPYVITADGHAQIMKRFKLEGNDEVFANTPISKVRLQYLATEKQEKDQSPATPSDEAVAVVDRILAGAISVGASDIHIQPEFDGVLVRYRLEGILKDLPDRISVKLHSAIVARFRVIAELDLTERNHPQDGRILAMFNQKKFNFRISILPTERGEKIVLRVFDVADVSRPLPQIYLHPRVIDMTQEALLQSHGAIIVGGATGSGKTSSLYSMLHERIKNRPGNNYVSVEDPVEFLLNGVVQVGVDERFGLTFSNILRSMLRQDPDTIMVGELRDPETAKTAAQAALTGHLVLATIHANNAFAAIQRLLHLDCDPLVLGQATNIIVVQRLIKKLCSECAKPENVPDTVINSMIERGVINQGESVEFFQPQGCSSCNQTGYQGRIVIADTLKANQVLKDLIAQDVPPNELRAAAIKENCYISAAEYGGLLIRAKLVSHSDVLMAIST